MAKSPIIIHLEELYKPLDNKWVNQNSLIINYALNCELIVGGSIAMAVSNKKPHKVPGDFDFFTDKHDDAMKFFNKLTDWLTKRPGTNFKVMFNVKNEYTLPGVSHHIRILVPFWKPICIMTMESPVRAFYTKGGLRVQYFDDVVAAAKHASTIDNKERLPFDVEACRKDIQERYLANGESYDVEIPTGALRRGVQNILVGNRVIPAPTPEDLSILLDDAPVIPNPPNRRTGLSFFEGLTWEISSDRCLSS